MFEAASLYYPGYKIQASQVRALIEQVDQKPRPEVFHIHLSGRYIFSRYPGSEFRSFNVYVAGTEQPDFYACPNKIDNKMYCQDQKGAFYPEAPAK